MTPYMQNTGCCGDWVATRDRIICRQCGAQSSLSYEPQCPNEPPGLFETHREALETLGTWLMISVLCLACFAALGWFVVGPYWGAL